MTIRCVLLQGASFAIPVLKGWFIDEWAPWYGPDGQGDANTDLLACCNRNRLPLAVVALSDDDQVFGTAALKSDSLGSEFGYSPWLAAVLVGKPFRGRGIGMQLIGAIEEEARRLGFPVLYTTTDSAMTILSRRGWVPTGDTIESLRGPVSVYHHEVGRKPAYSKENDGGAG